MNVGSTFNGGGVAGFGYPIGESAEIQVVAAVNHAARTQSDPVVTSTGCPNRLFAV
jgi:hypothetical protein